MRSGNAARLIRVILDSAMAGLLFGCGGGDTVQVDPVSPESNQPVVAAPVVVVPERRYTDFQARAGQIQCEPRSTVPAKERLKALVAQLQSNGIEVVSATCGNTGLMYPAICGGGTGGLFLVKVKPVPSKTMRALGFDLNSHSDQAPIEVDCELARF